MLGARERRSFIAAWARGICGDVDSRRVPRRSGPGRGAVAQLGERLLCKQEVTGSIPVSSTNTRPVVENRQKRSLRAPLSVFACSCAL
jgi:hypothetical protein